MGSDVKERGTLFSDYPQVLAVFGGADGSKRWERQVLCKQRPMIIGQMDRIIINASLFVASHGGEPIVLAPEHRHRPFSIEGVAAAVLQKLRGSF